jgi:exodeoxyribonuclease VII small subunit
LEKKATFEEALVELERIVERLEEGQLSLDEAVQSFEQGIALIKLCGRRLQQAEKKIDRLSQQTLEIFPSEEDLPDEIDDEEGDDGT